jgi:hypothetical protein
MGVRGGKKARANRENIAAGGFGSKITAKTRPARLPLPQLLRIERNEFAGFGVIKSYLTRAFLRKFAL